MFGALKEYMKIHGDCNFLRWTDKNIILARWANTQRENYHFKRLGDNQIKRLEDIGFIWDHTWEDMFNTLYEYKKNHGSCNVPHDWIEDNKPLGQWVKAQRRHLRSQSLVATQIKRLKEIGF